MSNSGVVRHRLAGTRVFTAAALILVAAPAAPLGAQAPARAALKIQALGVFADEVFAGGGLGVAWRTAARFTAEVNASLGAQAGALAARGEVLVAFHLDPFRTRGVSPYAGGGAAVLLRDGGSAEYLVVLLGVEARPGRRRGWFAEVGVGGGVRAALGARLRLR